MYYPEEVIEEIRQRNDIVDVISSYISLKRSGSNYVCCCPFHNEKTASFSVSRQKQIFHCFGCHEGGNVISFVMKYENFTFPEAVKALADRVGYALPEIEQSEEDKKKAGRKALLREVNTAAAAYFHFLLTKTERGKPGYRYYKEKRKFTDETIASFGLGYADIYADDLYKYLKKKGFSDDIIRDAGLVDFDERRGPHDKFWNRVMVPILDQNGKCIAFGGRVLGDAKPKYLNTKETEIFEKSRNLFALYKAKRSRRRGMILCEGYMDVITQHQAGIDNAIASLGTAFTAGQALLIKRYTKEVYLAYDSDLAGRKAAKKAIQILRDMDMSQRVIDLSPHKDPDEFLAAEGIEAYEERIRNAIPGRLFEIRELAGNFRMDDPEEKANFLHEAAELIAMIPDPAKRANYCETVAGEFIMDEKLLLQEVTRIGLSGRGQSAGAAPPEPGDDRVTEYQRDGQAAQVQRTVQTAQPQRSAQGPPGTDQTEEYLLTWMVNRPELFGILKDHISEEDFSGVVREVADQLYAQYRETGKVEPAAILSRYEESEDQNTVAGILSREMPFETERDSAEKALTELVKKLKLRSVDQALRSGQGSALALARQKKEIQKIKVTLP